MMITWLNVWQALMYLRLALSYILLVYLYIRVSQAEVVLSEGFIVSEQFFQVLFIYLDHPLIVGCTLTILVIYYKYSQRSRTQVKPNERLDTKDKKDLGLLA